VLKAIKSKNYITKVTSFVTLLLTTSVFILLFGNQSFAQHQKVKNIPKYDKQTFHFGFLLGINTSTFKVTRVSDFNMLDSIYTVEADPQAGFNLGIIANLRLAENFDLRFVPNLSFTQRNIDYTFYENGAKLGTTNKEIESTYLEFPVMVKFKSNRINNYRAYVIAGFKYSIDMVSQAKVENKDKEFVKLSRQDYGYEIGLGFDFYLERFKFSPQIKMYNGINNLLVDDPKVFSSSLESLKAKTFLISFLFE
jgi:Outer membrane protein beta-barrel domain